MTMTTPAPIDTEDLRALCGSFNAAMSRIHAAAVAVRTLPLLPQHYANEREYFSAAGDQARLSAQLWEIERTIEKVAESLNEKARAEG